MINDKRYHPTNLQLGLDFIMEHIFCFVLLNKALIVTSVNYLVIQAQIFQPHNMKKKFQYDRECVLKTERLENVILEKYIGLHTQ